MTTPLERAIEIAGGQRAMARALGGTVAQSHISYWLETDKVPAEHCRAIEKITDGKVTRYQLRPDVFGRRRV